MKQQQASLGRDRHLHLFGKDEPTGSFEVFVGQKYLHQAKQPFALLRAQSASERDVAFHDPGPRVRDRAGRQSQRRRRNAAQHGGYREVADHNQGEGNYDREPFHLVPPTIELLRLSELARQGVHRLSSLVHYVGAERVKPPGQRVDVVDRGAEPALHPIEPHAREDERWSRSRTSSHAAMLSGPMP